MTYIISPSGGTTEITQALDNGNIFKSQKTTLQNISDSD
jgi:hypothetical protein